MTRESILFNVRYSFHIEMMQATFYNRLDKLLTFVQIVLGSALFASYGSAPLFGGIIAVISVASFIWQPGKAAMMCETQSRKMKELINKPSGFSDEELHSAYLRAEESDNHTLGLLRDAAHKRALIASGCSAEAKALSLSFPEKIAAWFAGDLPKDG